MSGGSILRAASLALASTCWCTSTAFALPPQSAGTNEPAPVVELPSEPAKLAPEQQLRLQVGVDAADQRDRALARGLEPMRLEQPGTVLGGYGQLNLTSLKVGHDDAQTRANVRRIVLFVAHELSDDIHVYTEFEWENALACSSCQGSAEIEQAFIDWRLWGKALTLRTGLILVPMGIINEWHEPPVFHGVERPSTDQLVIPSTWRELGAGFTGQLAELYHYELYLTTTLDPTHLSANGIVGASNLGSVAQAGAFAVMGRFEVEPWLGVIGGVSFFASDMGGNAKYFTVSRKPRELHLPVVGYALDGRMRRAGFEARLLWTQFFLPRSGDLMNAAHDDGSLFFPNASVTGAVPTRTQGGYLELAYDVLHFARTTHALLGFVRLETYDTQAAVPKGFARLPAADVDELTMGLTYRPLAQLAFKTDVQLRDRRLGYDELQINGGVGYMF